MPYSNDLRSRAVNHYLNVHKNYQVVSSLFSIGIATLHEWVKRFRASGNVTRNKPPGRGRLILKCDEKEFYEMALNNADSSLEKLSEKWREKSGTQLSIMTVSRSIRRLHLTHKKNF